ncbi:CPXCG motif-containing cysteine-rich protein [Shewanella indica]|uniref:CPXCG motif-containing cysteine-rich protein n=1 Tax=Shewanella indica TaxID=768528 RepID=UPI001C03D315|nr:CPXCG motif-containing cysteine-rich protein [Shewanella indica]
MCCPHCGHHQKVELDASGGDQEFYNDCRVCCNPIHMRLHINDQRHMIELYVDGDDEQLY